MILHTNITGEGEPLVLIHSGGMTGLDQTGDVATLYGW